MLVLAPGFLTCRGIFVHFFHLSEDLRVIHSNLQIATLFANVETHSFVIVNHCHVSHNDFVSPIKHG